MTAYAKPALPPGVEHATNVLGSNAARVAVLGFIATHPGCLINEIVKGTDLGIGAVKNHVASLTVLGAVDVDPAPTVPYADRRGRRARYTINASVVREQYRTLGQFLGVE